ncbi:MAG: sulfatase-like hydrolase/transferase [Candidatus Hydrogenedentes bacterium]|nr:sulfatase-like hydrolase/transferase [Candidatus Hydrogenedentota bacterium]
MWGLVIQEDLSVGAILRTLEEEGLADNTIVAYTSDHGDMMGAHGLVEKTLMYEESVRIPWLLRIPQMRGRGTVVGGYVSHISLVPTLLELMDSKAARSLPGRSLVPVISGGKSPREPVFIQWNPPPNVESFTKAAESRIATPAEIDRVARERTRTVIAPDGWKLCVSDVDKSQLFDLKNDPGETTNLFRSAAHQDVERRLQAEIGRWQRDARDVIEASLGLRSVFGPKRSDRSSGETYM